MAQEQLTNEQTIGGFMNILGFIKVSALYAGVVLMLDANYAQARGPQDQAEIDAMRAAKRACMRFMTDNREGEVHAPGAVCSDSWMQNAFINTDSERAFNRCWGFFAARRVGGRATRRERVHAPSVFCRGNEQTTALLDGFRAINYEAFAECLEEIGSFFDEDIARCTKSLRYSYSTNEQKAPIGGGSAKGVRSAE